jgi:type II secretory ATPase GspE/PulE/Tfp pilus assembly ATPase PilB-like protein
VVGHPECRVLQPQLDALTASAGPERTSQLVDLVLADAVARQASDVHFEPTPRALEVRYRLDGVLHVIATVRRELAPNVIARLKVLAELLTYRVDVPQEGGIRPEHNRHGADMRVSTFPTVHGEKAAVRIFTTRGRPLELEELGLPREVQEGLIALAHWKDGVVFLTGPSGSGKTTTLYACLRHLVRTRPGLHVVTIEDPVEQVIEGVSQSQVRAGTEFDFARGLRSVLRQDPDVIMIGEVRDRETADSVIQAGLTGHQVFSTLHAGSACGVIGRLLEMRIEPYLLTSGLKGILNQRLVRRLCPRCKGSGCDDCAGTGYRGRVLLAEMLAPSEALSEAIIGRAGLTTLEEIAARSGRSTLWDAATQAVADGRTTWSEIERVLGPRPGTR